MVSISAARKPSFEEQVADFAVLQAAENGQHHGRGETRAETGHEEFIANLEETVRWRRNRDASWREADGRVRASPAHPIP